MARHQIFRKIIKDGKEEMELILDEEQPDTIVEIPIEEEIQSIMSDIVNMKTDIVNMKTDIVNMKN